MDTGLRKLADEARATPLVPGGNEVHPPATFKYSQLHINLIAHVTKGLGSGSTDTNRFLQPYRISLRDDAPSIDWNTHNINWPDFAREHRQNGLTCAPPAVNRDTSLPWSFAPRVHLAPCVRPAVGLRAKPAVPRSFPDRPAPTYTPPRTISPHQSGRMAQHAARLKRRARAGYAQIAPRSHPDLTQICFLLEPCPLSDAHRN